MKAPIEQGAAIAAAEAFVIDGMAQKYDHSKLTAVGISLSDAVNVLPPLVAVWWRGWLASEAIAGRRYTKSDLALRLGLNAGTVAGLLSGEVEPSITQALSLIEMIRPLKGADAKESGGVVAPLKRPAASVG